MRRLPVCGYTVDGGFCWFLGYGRGIGDRGRGLSR